MASSDRLEATHRKVRSRAGIRTEGVEQCTRSNRVRHGTKPAILELLLVQLERSGQSVAKYEAPQAASVKASIRRSLILLFAPALLPTLRGRGAPVER
jgi:hypothetical protein